MARAASGPGSGSLRVAPCGAAGPGKHCFRVGSCDFVVDVRYNITNALGNGAYGIVCAAHDTTTGSMVSIKKISAPFKHALACRRTLREITIMRQLSHDNVLGVTDLLPVARFEDLRDVYIVTPLMDTDLHAVLSSPTTLSVDHVRYFAYQLLRGLKYVHSAGIIHRDVKPSNLLVDADCEMRIADFGLSRTHSERAVGGGDPALTQYVATRWYRAPEVLLCCRQYSYPVDLWAVGSILAEMLARRPLFCGSNHLDQLRLIFSVIGSPTEEEMEFVEDRRARAFLRRLPSLPRRPASSFLPHAPPEACDLVDSLLVLRPDRRPSCAQALAHPFFSPLHDATDEPEAPASCVVAGEGEVWSEAQIKAKVYEEIRALHPEMPPLPPVATRAGRSVGPGPRSEALSSAAARQHTAQSGRTSPIAAATPAAAAAAVDTNALAEGSSDAARHRAAATAAVDAAAGQQGEPDAASSNVRGVSAQPGSRPEGGGSDSGAAKAGGVALSIPGMPSADFVFAESAELWRPPCAAPPASIAAPMSSGGDHCSGQRPRSRKRQAPAHGAKRGGACDGHAPKSRRQGTAAAARRRAWPSAES